LRMGFDRNLSRLVDDLRTPQQQSADTPQHTARRARLTAEYPAVAPATQRLFTDSTKSADTNLTEKRVPLPERAQEIPARLRPCPRCHGHWRKTRAPMLRLPRPSDITCNDVKSGDPRPSTACCDRCNRTCPSLDPPSPPTREAVAQVP